MGPLCILHVGCAETANKAGGNPQRTSRAIHDLDSRPRGNDVMICARYAQHLAPVPQKSYQTPNPSLSSNWSKNSHWSLMPWK